MAGVSISVEVLSSDKKEKEIRLHECWTCNDTGIVLYRKKTETGEYEYVAYCTCTAGMQYRYDGSKCKENKSPYYIPSIAQIADVAHIAYRNLLEFYMSHKTMNSMLKP